MKKEPKSIVDTGKAVLDRKGEDSALKESGRVMSTSERVFLRNMREKGVELMEENHLDVWFVTDYDKNLPQKWQSRQEMDGFANLHNEKVKANQDTEKEREYRFWHMDYHDMLGALREKYSTKLDHIQEIPELIVFQPDSGDDDSAYTGAPEVIHAAVDKCVNELYRYHDEDIITYLGENLCCPIADKFDYDKVEIDLENVIEYGLHNLELIQRKKQHTFFEKYILTKDEKYLVEFFSDDVLREIHDFICTFDEKTAYDLTEDFWGAISNEGREPENESDFFKQFKVSVDHEKLRAAWQAGQDDLKSKGQDVDEDDCYDWEYEEVCAAKENYVDHKKAFALFANTFSFEDIKEKMRSTYVATIKEQLDPYAAEYIQERDFFEAEKKLLKPVLVHVSENSVQRELMRDFGTEVVLEKISEAEIAGLLDLVGKMKASASSLMPEKLRRIKSEFYRSVENSLDNRSKVTAETEKEIKILDEIFEQAGGIKNVLDVACGYGRIDIPLLEKGYAVTGVDANEQFLQDALRKVIEKGLTGATFKTGDVIDYKSVVERGSQDAVIYTWHSILEAFGVGNLLHTLGSGWLALRGGGILVFDQPTRENPHMEEGWYGSSPDNEHHYLSYIMTEDEIRFILKMAGFENVQIKKWTTSPNEEYPDGMHKFTVSAQKPDTDEESKNKTLMYRDIISKARLQKKELKELSEQRSKEDEQWLKEYDKKKAKEKSA